MLRDEPEKKSVVASFRSNPYMKATAQVLGLPLAITAVDFPLIYIWTRVQANMPKYGGFFGSAFWRGARYAYTGSVLKNFALTQRAHIMYGMETITAQTELSQSSWFKILSGLSLGSIISVIDTASTEYLAKMRHMQIIGRELPPLQSGRDKFTFTRQAFMNRCLRNTTASSIFCLSNVAETYFSSMFPIPIYGTLPSTTATIIATAIPAAVITGPLDRIWRARVTAMNYETFSVPSFCQAAKNLYQREGLRGLVRGTPWGIASFVATFTAIRLFEGQVIDRFFTGSNKSNMFFSKPSIRPQQDVCETVTEEMQMASSLES